MDDHPQASLDLIAFGRAAVDAGLLASTCGNASLRLDEERMVISASGSALGGLCAGDACVVELATGHLLSGPKPSMESDLHRLAYLARPAARAVLHCQSRAATVLCCHPDPPGSVDYIPEVPAYVREHAYVPFALPGTTVLAESVRGALEDPEVTIVQMVNHGQIIIGATASMVVRRGTFFELACSMAMEHPGLRTIGEADVATLRGYARDC